LAEVFEIKLSWKKSGVVFSGKTGEPMAKIYFQTQRSKPYEEINEEKEPNLLSRYDTEPPRNRYPTGGDTGLASSGQR
jgi:hypothetical protein